MAFYTLTLKLAVRCEPMFHVEGRILTHNGLLLFAWMESCLIGTHTTSSYIYELDISKVKHFCPKSFIWYERSSPILC